MSLYIKDTGKKGRGVFSHNSITKDELIERCNVILLDNGKDSLIAKHTLLVNYLFNWDLHEEVSAIALGFGSLYNHSIHANAFYIYNKQEKTIEVYAVVDIPAHTEITINYNGNSTSSSMDWFYRRNIQYYE